MENKQYVINLIYAIRAFLTEKRTVEQVADLFYDDLIKYKRMWDTLKAESGYRYTASPNIPNYTPTVRELMEKMENRSTIADCDRKVKREMIEGLEQYKKFKNFANDMIASQIEINNKISDVFYGIYTPRIYTIDAGNIKGEKAIEYAKKQNLKEKGIKIYCSECKYYTEGVKLYSGKTSDKCDAPENKNPYDTFKKICYTWKKFPKSINKHNDCLWFKEK